MSATSIDLLRHGETTGGGGFRGSLDDALTPLGWAQMREAVAAGGPWDVIVSSPLRRCRAFADALAADAGLPLVIEPDLCELHFGAWEGCSASQLMASCGESLGLFWRDPYAFTPPDGEPLTAFEQRVTTAIAALRQRFAGQRLLVVTHGGVMRLLLARARGLPREALLQVEVAHGALHALEAGPCGRC